jgi:hypothetical protein
MLAKEKPMRLPKTKRSTDMLDHYDFSKGVRGKYAKRFSQGTNLVLLEPDVAKAFPDAASVNETLRALAGIIRRQKKVAVSR